MIRWLVQSTADDPRMECGTPPPHLLSEAESNRFWALPNEKRRRDWLLGRWTGKRLAAAHLRQAIGESFPLYQVSIENDPSRAPYVLLASGDSGVRLPISLSISHSNGRALCALVDAEHGEVGADIEQVESRTPGFVEEYFNPEEAQAVSRAAKDRQAWLATAIWSAKEAVLKALHVGLSVETHSVTCLPHSNGLVRSGWTAFTVTANWQRLDLPRAELFGWQRSMDGFALSLALSRRVVEHG
jgi:4'-phosphopantetheinyl transferase